jgi:hypothetical protein
MTWVGGTTTSERAAGGGQRQFACFLLFYSTARNTPYTTQD